MLVVGAHVLLGMGCACLKVVHFLKHVLRCQEACFSVRASSCGSRLHAPGRRALALFF